MKYIFLSQNEIQIEREKRKYILNVTVKNIPNNGLI